MIRFISPLVAVATLVVILMSAPAKAQTVEEARAIENTIRSQIAAMQEDDWAEAFTFASPMIQGIFGNPENFSRMVTTGYPMVWRPKRVEIGELSAGPRGPQQTMFFEDQSGRLYIADYYMVFYEGEWRINGVQIRPAPEESV